AVAVRAGGSLGYPSDGRGAVRDGVPTRPQAGRTGRGDARNPGGEDQENGLGRPAAIRAGVIDGGLRTPGPPSTCPARGGGRHRAAQVVRRVNLRCPTWCSPKCTRPTYGPREWPTVHASARPSTLRGLDREPSPHCCGAPRSPEGTTLSPVGFVLQIDPWRFPVATP